MSASAVKLGALVKAYPPRQLLRGIDLELAAAHSYVLTGDNGCGKTTLMRIIAGLESADGGVMHIEGEPIDLHDYPEPLRRRLVYVHQQPYLFDTSIAHNIAYGLKVRGVARDASSRLVRDAIAWAGVGHLAGVPPHKLSGGEKQRVALARAKVLNPHLLLLDEPTANLDTEARRQAIGLIAKVHEEGVTVLIATHDREIMAMPGVQRLHLDAGRIGAG
jgi:tungstate transport system ATP-binding protein